MASNMQGVKLINLLILFGFDVWYFPSTKVYQRSFTRKNNLHAR